MKTLALLRTPLSAALARGRLVSCAVVTGWMLVGAPQAGAVMMDIGAWPGMPGTVTASAISGDGKVIGGTLDNGNLQLFWWSAQQGFTAIGPADTSRIVKVIGLSADGSVVVGDAAIGPGNSRRAFRWTAAQGLTDLGTLAGKAISSASGVSSNGNVVVGASYNNAGDLQAFRWEAGLMKGLHSLSGSLTQNTSAFGVSGDGKVTVGQDNGTAVRWDETGNVFDLGIGDRANAANFDGSVVVGRDGTTAFRWTALTGGQNLGTLGGSSSDAKDVNADGSVVVGSSRIANSNTHAFRWTTTTGMVDLGVLSGESNSAATGVSDDGNVIVGTSGARAFIWTRDALQDLDNLQLSQITSAATLGQLTAAQNRRLRDLNQQQCIPTDTQPYCLSGGLGTYRGEGASTGNQVIGQASAGLRISEQFAVGASVNLGQADLKSENAKQTNAYGLALWGAYQQQPDALGWVANASVGMGHSRSSFERGVGLTDVQRAQARTAMNSTGVRLAVGYGVQVGSSRVTPEIALSHARTQSDGFTERNVALPLTLNAASSDETYATLGVRSETPLNAKTTLHLGAAVDALLDDNTDPIEGHSAVPGMGRFQLRSHLDKRNLLPMANAGVSYALSPNSTVSGQVQVGAATHKDQSAVYGLGVQYRYAF